jgi:hypothetical protein
MKDNTNHRFFTLKKEIRHFIYGIGYNTELNNMTIEDLCHCLISVLDKDKVNKLKQILNEKLGENKSNFYHIKNYE